jgi:hypothetical protein
MRLFVFLLALAVASCGGMQRSGGGGSPEPSSALLDREVDGGEPDTALASVGVEDQDAAEVALHPVTCDPPGAIDEAAVDAYFEGLLPAFTSCYAAALDKAPGVDGTYVVEVVFAEEGRGRSDGYFFVETGFMVVGFKECLGDHLIDAAIDTPPATRASCKLVLRFGAGPHE